MKYALVDIYGSQKVELFETRGQAEDRVQQLIALGEHVSNELPIFEIGQIK